MDWGKTGTNYESTSLVPLYFPALSSMRKCHRGKEKYQVRGLLAQRSKLVKTSGTVCQFRTVSEFAQSADSAQVIGTPGVIRTPDPLLRSPVGVG